ARFLAALVSARWFSICGGSTIRSTCRLCSRESSASGSWRCSAVAITTHPPEHSVGKISAVEGFHDRAEKCRGRASTGEPEHRTYHWTRWLRERLGVATAFGDPVEPEVNST